MPITRWKPRSVGARAIADLASEMERRVAELNLGLVRPDVESASLVAGAAAMSVAARLLKRFEGNISQSLGVRPEPGNNSEMGQEESARPREAVGPTQADCGPAPWESWTSETSLRIRSSRGRTSTRRRPPPDGEPQEVRPAPARPRPLGGESQEVGDHQR